MKKYLLLYFIVFTFLLGCAAFKPKVEGNTFYCSFPELEVEVSQELQFVGEKKMRMDGEGQTEKRPLGVFYKSFVFEGMSNQLTISVIKLPRDWQFITPSFDGGGNNLYFGKLRLGNHNYQYLTSKEGPYIKRAYFRNVHTDSIQIRIIYMEKRDTELSEGEQIILFDQNCKAAFTIKPKKFSSLSKRDSSISADYQKILGHWWTQGENMFIEERKNRLSIQMKRPGARVDPSGQYMKFGYKQTTNTENISWDGKHLEFEIWMPTGGGYEVFYSLTLSDPNTLFGTKQASGSSLKIEVEFEKQ